MAPAGHHGPTIVQLVHRGHRPHHRHRQGGMVAPPSIPADPALVDPDLAGHLGPHPAASAWLSVGHRLFIGWRIHGASAAACSATACFRSSGFMMIWIPASSSGPRMPFGREAVNGLMFHDLDDHLPSAPSPAPDVMPAWLRTLAEWRSDQRPHPGPSATLGRGGSAVRPDAPGRLHHPELATLACRSRSPRSSRRSPCALSTRGRQTEGVALRGRAARLAATRRSRSPCVRGSRSTLSHRRRRLPALLGSQAPARRHGRALPRPAAGAPPRRPARENGSVRRVQGSTLHSHRYARLDKLPQGRYNAAIVGRCAHPLATLATQARDVVTGRRLSAPADRRWSITTSPWKCVTAASQARWRRPTNIPEARGDDRATTGRRPGAGRSTEGVGGREVGDHTLVVTVSRKVGVAAVVRAHVHQRAPR